MSEERKMFEPREQSTQTGHYIRCHASTHRKSWTLSTNAVDGTIHLNVTAEHTSGLYGLSEEDVACLEAICARFLAAARKPFWKEPPRE